MTNQIEKIYHCGVEYLLGGGGSGATSGSGAPTTVPQNIGDVYIDTDNDNIYQAVGTSSVSDWVWINTRPKCGFVDILMVGGGGDGGDGYGYNVSNYYRYGGGGGGGRVIGLQRFGINSGVHEIKTQTQCVRGKDLCGFGLVAYGGGHGGGTCIWCSRGCLTSCGWNGGGWGGSSEYTESRHPITMDGGNCGGETCTGNSGYITGGGGGGGAGGNGGTAGYKDGCCTCVCGGDGGGCVVSDISGQSVCYAGGGGGGTGTSGLGGCGFGVGGDGWGGSYSSIRQPVDACCCGSGGGGGVNMSETVYNYRGHGGCPILIVRYKLDGSCGIKEALGGDITCCDGYKIHTYEEGTQDLFFRFNS